MSLLNVWCSDERAIVAVNTLGGESGTNAPQSLSKLFYLAHANTVIAARGVLGLAQSVFNHCLVHQGDFDSYAADLTQMCEAGRQWVIDGARVANIRVDLDSAYLHLAMVGWSGREQRMRAIQCERAPFAARFACSVVESDSVAPGEPWTSNTEPAPALPLNTPDRMFAAAQAQMRWWHANHRQLPTGGRLVIAELSRDETSVSSRALPSATQTP